MPNIAELANLASALNTIGAAGQAIKVLLVTPQIDSGYYPQNLAGFIGPPPPPLLFHYEGEQTISLSSDITDHFIEDNTAVQDQIALRPETITTQGFIGELSDIPNVDGGVTGSKLPQLKTVANKLFIVSGYIPSLSTTALEAYNAAKFAYDTGLNFANGVKAGWTAARGTSDQPTQTRQSQMFTQMYGYWQNRTLFTVYTPYAKFENMAILSCRSIQSAETKMISDFEVTFKQIKFVKDLTKQVNPTTLNGRASNQAEPLVNLGTSTPSVEVNQADALSDAGLTIPGGP
jgi:hypothetical protein